MLTLAALTVAFYILVQPRFWALVPACATTRAQVQAWQDAKASNRGPLWNAGRSDWTDCLSQDRIMWTPSRGRETPTIRALARIVVNDGACT
jgi:hypothetical protein